MVFYCFVKGCKSTTYAGKDKSDVECISWHRLPADAALQEKWADSLGVEAIPKSSRICSKHFSPVCFDQSGLSKQRLKPSSVPTLLLPSRSQNGALREIVTNTNNYNPTEKENRTEVSRRPDVEQLKSNSASSCLPLTTARNSQQERTLDTVAMEETSNVAMPETLPETPKKIALGNIRYPGDINEEILSKMSPKTVIKTMLMLKKACKDKDAHIKRLQRTQRGQKRKLETLQQILTDLRKNDLISSNAKDIPENPNTRST